MKILITLLLAIASILLGVFLPFFVSDMPKTVMLGFISLGVFLFVLYVFLYWVSCRTKDKEKVLSGNSISVKMGDNNRVEHIGNTINDR